jgi:hypothetical protein
VSAILISLGALLAGLEIVRRLTVLELGHSAANATVRLMAFGPWAIFLSAAYTESLFLALSAGTFYAARRGRWATAGALGGLAAMTRITGVLLIVPIVLLFFYGPRSDRPPGPAGAWWRPRYRIAPQALWALLIPAGVGLFAAYLALRGFRPAATLHADGQFWGRHLVGPLAGIANGLQAAWHELKLGLSGVAPSVDASPSVLQLGALIASLAGLCVVLRRLPIAYGAYVALGLLVPLSTTTSGDPLKDLDRYASILFPLFMGAGAWATERRALRALLLASAVLLAVFCAQFATWHWVGSSSL